MNFLRGILIEPFEQGEWLFGVIFWVLFLGLLVFVTAGAVFVVDEIRWASVDPFPHRATLVSQGYKASTRRTSAVPVVTGNGGVGVGVASSGEPEKYVTEWDCGEYGRLVSTDKAIYRWAKNEATLLLKVRGERTRIVGIYR